jgi:nitroreductase
MNILKAIIKRRSVRNYTGDKLIEKHKAILNDYLKNENNLQGPFGNTARIVYQEVKELKKKEKIGTYGFIKKAPSYLISICKNNRETLIDLGYVFENLVLLLQTHGIGTCWMGGTFTRKKLQVNMEISEDEFIPIISPIGYAADNKHIVEKIIRKTANSNKRKDPNKLFFYNDFNTPLENGETKDLAEYIRAAPSASNKQPWRLIFTDNGITHFFIQRTPGYAKSTGYDMQIVDMGIALSHYAHSFGKKQVFKENPEIQVPDDNISYLFSVR